MTEMFPDLVPECQKLGQDLFSGGSEPLVTDAA